MNAQLKNISRQLGLAPEFVLSREGQDILRLLLKLASAEAVTPLSLPQIAPVLAFTHERFTLPTSSHSAHPERAA